MKKLTLVFAFLGVLLLSACTPKEVNIDNEILDEISNWIIAEIPTTIDGDINLPTTDPVNGGNITWMSADLSVITDDGQVVLEYGVKSTALSYTISIEDLVESYNLDVVVYSHKMDQVAEEFERQFKRLLSYSFDVKTEFFDFAKVTWTNDDLDTFSKEGEFVKPENDGEITFSYVVSRGDEKKSYTFTIEVLGRSITDKTNEIKEWITSEYIQSRVVDANVSLPLEYIKKDNNGDIAWTSEIIWNSGNVGIISNEGVITQYGFSRYVNLSGSIVVNGLPSVIDFDLVVPAKTFATEKDKINSFLDAIAVEEINRIVYKGYNGINQTYHILPFHINENYYETGIIKQIIAVNSSAKKTARTGTPTSGIELITIHDTANTNSTATAKMHANLQTNGFSASWHFTVDEDGGYQSIPLDEVAYHAGDGGTLFKLLDTGIKADYAYPVITISKDGFFEYNGVKSKLVAPKIAPITEMGIYTEVSENGNYLMNETYFNKDWGKVANKGGNNNSIGIETAVNDGSDYGMTFRNTAKIVSELLIMNNLHVDRVMTHNNMSGKFDPRPMRESKYWSAFLDLIQLEKYARQELADVEFVWTSNTSILSNDGRIAMDITGYTEVAYDVAVTYPGGTINKSFTTKLKQ
jgi:N-acetylmuramoyl-L-alanine amidase CwlA